MNSNRTHHTSKEALWTEADFNIAAALKDATDVSQPPASLYRSVRWERSAGVLAGLLLTVGLSTAAFFQWLYPPELVREAMIHEHREATLRGDFQKNKLPMLMAMGLRDGGNLPGLLQMQRPCEIAGKTAYHLTTFIEKGGGIVTILAFAQPMPGSPLGEGQWMGRHWRFAEGLPGRTVLLLADNAKVLSVTEDLLKKG